MIDTVATRKSAALALRETRFMHENLAWQENAASHQRDELALYAINSAAADGNTNAVTPDVVANLSHEIRTPMSGILGVTEMALRTEVNEQTREYLSLIRDSASSLLDLVNDVLDCSRLESGRLNIEHEAFSLRTCVEKTVRSMQLSAQAKGLMLTWQLTVDGAEGTDLLLGAPVRLRQILVNLLGNAIKFTHRGHVKLNVNLSDGEAGEVVCRFDVSDSGIGIAEHNLEKIFSRFEQADSSTSARYGGSGLGLHISSQLAKLLGGKLWVESRIGHGSVFHVTARFQRAAPARARCEQPAADKNDARATPGRPVAKVPAVSAAAADGEALKILLADDDPLNSMLVAKILQDAGHVVEVVADGKQAVEQLDECKYDLVLMDISMPCLDGIAATAEIRQREKAGGFHLPVVAMSAYAQKTHRERCLQAGMDGYLVKPVRPADLLVAISGFKCRQRPTGHPQATENKVRVIDVEALMERVGPDQRFLDEIVVEFRRRERQLLADARAALRSNNQTELQQVLHCVTGTLRNLGAGVAAELSSQLELKVERSKPSNCQGLEPDIALLELNMKRFSAELARVSRRRRIRSGRRYDDDRTSSPPRPNCVDCI